MEIELAVTEDPIFPSIGNKLGFSHGALFDVVILANDDIAKNLCEIGLVCG